jgi:two-component system CheB/CheR fusion protein
MKPTHWVSEEAKKLRQQAIDAMQTGAIQPEPTGAPALADSVRLLEELRIHQAELEVQNGELQLTRLRAEEARHYYQSLFDSLPIVALVVDTSGMIAEANAQAFELFGFRSAAALRQHSVYRLMQRASASALAEYLRRPADARGVALPIMRFKSAGAELLSMEVHLQALTPASMLDRRYLLLMVDRTTELAKAHEALLYETILNHSDALIYAFDHDARCLFANDALLRFRGLPRTEVIGRHRSEWLSDEDAQEREGNDAQVLSAGTPMVFEEKIRSSDAAHRYFISQKFPLRDDDGEIFAVAGISTDVTKTTEAARRLELAMHVFSQGTEGVMITDASKRIISVNRAFTQITGYTEPEALGHTPKILSSGRHDREFYEAMWNRLNTEGQWEGEIWNRRKNGEVYPEWLTVSRVGLTPEDAHYVGVFADITGRKLAEEKIEQLAFYDALTSLPNRHLLKDRVAQSIRVAQRTETTFGITFMDLDHFKEVNDIHGHNAGDELLQQVVERIRARIRTTDTAARLGGDEFVLLLVDMPVQEMAARINTILHDLAQPYVIHGKQVHVSASAGLVVFPSDGIDFDTLLKHADMAMYQAKSAGRNSLRLFNAGMATEIRTRHQLESELRSAIERNELHVVYQPLVCLHDARLAGLEALLRWNSMELGIVSPEQFIPVAEDTGLIHSIGDWVLEQVAMQASQWLSNGFSGFTMAVNLSAKQFWNEDFVGRIAALVSRYDLPAYMLELELTERIAMGDAERAIGKMQALRDLGIRLSIDDFGTGYSSLAYLRWMPVDVLKIDKSFVDDIGRDQDDEFICRTIINLGRSLGLTVLAEGVETQEQADFLLNAGCQLAQGFLFSRPIPPNEIQIFLQSWSKQSPGTTPDVKAFQIS